MLQIYGREDHEQGRHHYDYVVVCYHLGIQHVHVRSDSECHVPDDHYGVHDWGMRVMI